MLLVSASRVALLVGLAFLAVLLLIAYGDGLLEELPLAPLAALAWLGITSLLLGSWLRRREMERRAGDKAVTILQ